MAFKLIRHDEPLPPRNLVIIIFGEPGVSKTSLSFTAEKPVLWAFDAKGLDRAVNRKDAIRFDNWADYLEYMDSDEIERNGYKTGIFDTGGAMLDEYLAPYIVSMNEKYGNGMGGLGLSGYGVMKDSASKMFTRAEQKGLDLIFICHTETEKEGDNLIRVPKMTGGARDILVAKADLIGYMEMRNNKITLEFNPTSRHAGKNCARFPVLEIPHFEKDPDKFNTYMAGIIKQTKDHLQKMSEAQAAAVKNVADFRDRISSFDTIQKLEAIHPEIEALSPSYRAQVNQFFNKKYAELWAAVNIYTEGAEFTKPEHFEKLSADMKALPKPVQEPLYDVFRKLLENAGLTYDKPSGKFIAKGSTPPAPAPTPAPPTKTETKPAAATKKEKAGKPGKADKTAKPLPAPVDQKWFHDRVGKEVMKYNPDGSSEKLLVETEDHADHFFGVTQNMKGCRFTDINPEPEADPLKKEFDNMPEPETSSVSTEAPAANG